MMGTQATAVVAKHGYRDRDHGSGEGRIYCWCGWSQTSTGPATVDREVHAAHVIMELEAARILCMDIPQGGEVNYWQDQFEIGGSVFHLGEESSGELRAEAGKLLAAAEAIDELDSARSQWV